MTEYKRKATKVKNYDLLMGEAYRRGFHDGASVRENDTGQPVLGFLFGALSGEWAGESIPELFGLAVGEDYDDSVADDYEQQYADGFQAGLAPYRIGFDGALVLLAE